MIHTMGFKMTKNDGVSLGVLFVRLAGFPPEFTAEVFDCGEKGFFFDKPRLLDAKDIPGQKGSAEILFHPLLNPFRHKDQDHIEIEDRRQKLFFTKPSDQVLGIYQNSVSPILQPSISLTSRV